MENKWKILFVIFCILFILSFAINLILFIVASTLPKITVDTRLVTTVSDDDKHAWEYMINGQEVPVGTKLKLDELRGRVMDNFEISLKDFYSRKIVDRVNISSLLKDGDIITYHYFSPKSEWGEKIFVEIQHKDGTIRWVSLNIY